jgi:hypothetical protein
MPRLARPACLRGLRFIYAKLMTSSPLFPTKTYSQHRNPGVAAPLIAVFTMIRRRSDGGDDAIHRHLAPHSFATLPDVATAALPPFSLTAYFLTAIDCVSLKFRARCWIRMAVA